jgi:hypothetical protein
MWSLVQFFLKPNAFFQVEYNKKEEGSSVSRESKLIFELVKVHEVLQFIYLRM